MKKGKHRVKTAKMVLVLGFALVFSLSRYAYGYTSNSDARVRRSSFTSYILNGRNDGTPVPYQLSLREGENHRCGAVIISRLEALTAAHCLHNDLDTKEKWYKIAKAVKHARYNITTLENDIALLLVEEPGFEFNEHVDRIKLLDTAEEFDDTLVTTSGWGKTGYHEQPSHILLSVDLQVLSRNSCRQYSDYNARVKDTMLCTIGINGSEGSTCKGDSGGPLVLHKYHRGIKGPLLIGITSWGPRNKCGGLVILETERDLFYTGLQKICVWFIVSKRGEGIKFKLLDTQEIASLGQDKLVNAPSGSFTRENSALVARTEYNFTSGIDIQITEPRTLYAVKQSYMILFFITKSGTEKGKSGFYLQLKTVGRSTNNFNEVKCTTISGPSNANVVHNFQYPPYMPNYVENTLHFIHVQTLPLQMFNFTMLQVDTEVAYDWLKVGYLNTTDMVTETSCSLTGLAINSSICSLNLLDDQSTYMLFSSDGSLNGKGFKFNYTFDGNLSICVDCTHIEREMVNTDRVPTGGPIPYQLSLTYHDNHVCGAVIITQMEALITANCLHNRQSEYYNISDMRLVAGLYDHKRTNTNNITVAVHEIASVVIHPGYDRNTVVNDIAILRIKEPGFSFNEFVNKIEISGTEEKFAGLVAAISGWSSGRSYGPHSRVLTKLDLQILSLKDCQAVFQGARTQFVFQGASTQFVIEEGTICAEATGGGSTCRGDGGGPLVIYKMCNGVEKPFLVGLSSYGVSCNNRFPAMFTQVNKYTSWIQQNLQVID